MRTEVHCCAPAAPDTAVEAELVRRCRCGDGVAFGTLMRRHHGLMLAVCRRVTRHDHDAEDALQEAMRAAWRGMPTFDGRSTISTWLYRIAHNEAVDVASRARRAPMPMEMLPAADHASAHRPGLSGATGGSSSATDRYGLDACVVDRIAIEQAMAQVPAAFRSALVMRDVFGWTYAEIAAELGVKIDTVKSRISRGRGVVRGLLAEPLRQHDA